MADYTAPDRSQLQTSEDRNKINIAMRESPLWQNAIRALGHDPNGPLKLNKDEQKKLAVQLGLPLDDFHIDPAGNINDFHGWKGLPTGVKIAIIAGAAVGTAGAAGAFGGGAGATSALGGVGVGETAATGVGGLTATSLGLAPTVGLGTAGTAAATGGIGSTLLGAAEKYAAKKGITTAADLLRGGGQAVGNAANAAEDNRLTADESRRKGQNDYENQLVNRSKLEAGERQQALKDLYRQSYAANRKPGPYNAAGLTPYSADYMSGLSAIEQQGLARLQKPAAYDTAAMPALAQFVPAPQGKVERIGNYAAPALTLGGMALDYYRGR